MIKLVPVTDADIEWLRTQRNRPELYRYFRQDKPISERDQALWWKGLNKSRVKLFVVNADGEKVGYVGFNPINRYASSAEFGIFIVPEHAGKGYGTAAMYLLLKDGFDNGLATIYSDCLQYPGENRFSFYERMGFAKYSDACQNIRYKKQGVMIPSVKFYMTRDAFNDNVNQGKLGPEKETGLVGKVKEKLSKGSGFRPGKNYVKSAA